MNEMRSMGAREEEYEVSGKQERTGWSKTGE
jgi:hypothetical protein